jgi:hypothetical protein
MVSTHPEQLSALRQGHVYSKKISSVASFCVSPGFIISLVQEIFFPIVHDLLSHVHRYRLKAAVRYLKQRSEKGNEIKSD